MIKQNKSISKLVSTQKIAEMIRKQNNLHLDMTDKYNRFKRSASTSNYYLNQARLKKVNQIYRSLTAQKMRTISQSKSLRTSHLHTPEKKKQTPYVSPFHYQNQNQLTEKNHKAKHKLTIHRGTQNQAPTISHDSNYHLTARIKSFRSKLRDCQQMKVDSLFLDHLADICSSFRTHKDENSRQIGDQFVQCLKMLEECCARRESIKMTEMKKNYSSFEEQFGNLQVELKKKSIRAVLDQKNIQKSQNQLNEARKEIEKLKEQSNKSTKNVGVNTDIHTKSTSRNSSENDFLPSQLLQFTQTKSPIQNECGCSCFEDLSLKKIELIECKKKLFAAKQRQNELIGVLVVIQKEGMDVERIYSDIVSGKVSASEIQSSNFAQETDKLRKKQNRMYHKCRNVRFDSSGDADDSIVSSAQGISFDYEDKSIEEDVFTERNVYKCKKELDPQMKDKLKLDFNVLYEEVDAYDFEEDIEDVEDAPTL